MLGQAERLIELKSFFRRNIEENSTAKIFAFTSGKGGTGKTFLSLNISHELARLGKKVLYIDFDLNLANAHLMLDIHPKSAISGFFSSRALLNEIIYEYDENFHLIFGDSGNTNFPEINENHVESFLEKIKELNSYDIIILDLPAGAGKNVISALAYADYAVLIAATEPTAVMDAYALVKLIKYERLLCSIHVLVNKCKSQPDGKMAYENLNTAAQHFLKSELNFISCIEYNNEVYDAICAQKLASKIYPDSRLNKQIKTSVNRIAEILHLANIHHPVQKIL